MEHSHAVSNGALSKIGRYSWVLTLVALIGGPFGSYMLFKQEMLVVIAQQQLQINENESQIKEVRDEIKDMVPKQVHEQRWELQKEIDDLRSENAKLYVQAYCNNKGINR